MNILLLHTHDSGRFLQPYGYALETPHLKTLAERGTLFRQAFSVAPTCSPSRAGMLTGQYPHNCGMFGLAHRGFSLPDYHHHMARYLTNFGYETVLCGIQHEAPNADLLGYTKILDGQTFDMGCIDFDSFAFDRENAGLVCDYLKQPRDKPFFLSFGMYNTHLEVEKHEEDIDARYVAPFPGVYNNAQNREDMADYMSSVRFCDSLVGQVLQTLEEAGLREETMVIFTTDHGPAVPGMKCTLYDGGTGVALLLDYPGNPAKGRCVDEMVSHLDLFPTICDLCQIEKPDWLEGQSLLPLLKREGPFTHRVLFSEVNYHAAYEPMRAARSERYKYIRRFDERPGHILSNIDNCPEKTFLYEYACLRDTDCSSEELYDLYADPMENRMWLQGRNMHRYGNRWRRRCWSGCSRRKTPCCLAQLEAPVGARVNRRDDYCAEDLAVDTEE